MTDHKSKIIRYNALLPESLYDELTTIAARESITTVEVLRRFIKIGLLVDKVTQSQGKFFIREDNVDREIVLMS